MSDKTRKRNFAKYALVAAVFCGAGFAWAQTTEPTAAPEKPIAVVNGIPLNDNVFKSLVMEAAGFREFNVVLDQILVTRACMTAGLKIDSKDETKRFLVSHGAPGDLTPEQTESTIQQLLPRMNMSRDEFELNMQTSAGLRAMSQGRVEVTDEEIRRQFDTEYGEQAKVILFQTKSLMQSSDLRQKVEKQNEDPAIAARELQIPSQELTVPKSDTSLPEDIRTVIFTLKEKQLSASILKGGSEILVYLVQKTPAKTDTKLDSVKDRLRKEVLDAKEAAYMNNTLSRLRLTAAVEVNDPVLKPQWDNYVARLRQQLQAAATQSATQPATAPAK